MQIKAVKSKIITVKDDLMEVIFEVLKSGKNMLRDNDILIVTSKVLSITQGRVKRIRTEKEFEELVEKEADAVIGKSQVTLTVKNGIYIPWAGIDRSNVRPGYAVLWPKKPFEAAQKICSELKKKYRLKHLGVIITDSHCVPRRRGIMGIAIGYAGIKGVNDLRGEKDLYGNTLKVTQQNVADMLASAALLEMGEAAEQTPFAIVRDAPVVFTNRKTDKSEPVIAADECLFSPMYKQSAIDSCKRKK